MTEQYFIKKGYRVNRRPRPYNDSEEDSVTYQLAVYQFALGWARQLGAKTLIDIGCGYGLKLSQFSQQLGMDIVGLDDQRAIDYCREHNHFGRWLVDNIEKPQLEFDKHFDLIITADVIEHLADPDTLIAYMRRCSHANTYIVLSTPERDLRRGPKSMGPPQNPAHIREWNQAEFAMYLTDRGLNIREHRITELRHGRRTCQTALAQFG